MICEHELAGKCNMPRSHGTPTCPEDDRNGDTCCLVCEGRGTCEDACKEAREET